MRYWNRLIAVAIAGWAAIQGGTVAGQSYRIERIASGLRQPVYVDQAPGDPANIIYYMTRVTTGGANAGAGTHGSIWRYDINTRQSTEILNLSHRDLSLDLGPQGFTFHPDFNTPGAEGYQKLYVSSATPGGPQNFVEEYVASGPNGTVPVDGGTGEPIVNRLLLQYQNVSGQNNHVIDWIGFDPRAYSAPVGSPERNYLYISTGDGSNGLGAPDRPEQKANNPQGKLLRIDVDENKPDFYPGDPLKNFAIPETNPIPLWNATHNANEQLVGTTLNYSGGSESYSPALPEIYFTGTRNAFRMSIDRLTGDFWSADVGEIQREEINFMRADPYDGSQPPHDFGFPQREGTGDFISQAEGDTFITWNLSGGGNVVIDSVNPIQEGDHSQFNQGSAAGDVEIRSTNRSAYIGGYVYRGPVEELQGKYFYADFVQGNIFSLDFDRDTPLEDFSGENLNQTDIPGEQEDLARLGTREVVLNRNLDSLWHTIMFDPQDPTYTPALGIGFGIGRVVSFGEDNAGNLYIVDMGGTRGDAGFGNDYPGGTTGQIFRIAPNLQIVVTVDRETGEMTFTNATGGEIDILGYRIVSGTGSINPDELTPITDRLDNSDDGNGTIDPDNAWQVTSAPGDRSEFAESSTGTAATFSVDEEFTLSPEDGWLKSIYEDLQLEVTLSDSSTLSANVTFVGNDGQPFQRSDLNFNGMLDPGDWAVFKPNHLTDLSGLSLAQSYQLGDLDGDGDNDFDDFRLFQSDYINALGAGAFAALLNVPEPASSALLVVALCGAGLVFRRRSPPRMAACAVATCGLMMLAAPASADLVHQYTFNDGTATDSVGNAHGTLMGNTGVTLGVVDFPGGEGDFVDLPAGTIDIDDFVDASFEAWFTYRGGGAWQRVFDFGRTTFGGQGRDYIFFSPNSGGGEARAAITDNGGGADEDVAIAGPALNTDQTYHLAVVVDDSLTNQFLVYLNGALAGSTNLTNSLSDVSNSNAYLGDSNWTGDASLNGTIDEFRIYNHALSPAEVLANFQAGPVPIASLEIVVNTVTGSVSLVNANDTPLVIDYYRVASPSGALNPDGWISLDDQNIDAIGAGEGESWDVLGQPHSQEVAEGFLLAASTVSSATSLHLGNLFETSVFGQGSEGDLEFQFALQNDALKAGAVTYVTPDPLDADYNNDGVVNAADFVLWRNTLGSSENLAADGDGDQLVDLDDYTLWTWAFGASAGSGAGLSPDAVNVPEPATPLLAMLATICACVCRL